MQQAETSDHLPISGAEIRRQLDRILGFGKFQASDRRREMLSFVVEETIAGRSSRLKATTIAMAVFDRGPDFDQQADPVVRLEARKLRRDLDNYYAGAGRDDPVRIDIPKGAYVPVFRYQDGPPGATQDEAVAAPEKSTPDPRRWYPRAMAPCHCLRCRCGTRCICRRYRPAKGSRCHGRAPG